MIRKLKIHQITALTLVPLEMLQGSSIIVVSQIYLCNVFWAHIMIWNLREWCYSQQTTYLHCRLSMFLVLSSYLGHYKQIFFRLLFILTYNT